MNQSRRVFSKAVAVVGVVSVLGIVQAPTAVGLDNLVAPSLATDTTGVPLDSTFPTNAAGTNADRITRTMTITIPTSASIPTGSCVRLWRADADAAGTPTSDFVVVAGGTKGATTLFITDGNRGGKLLDGRYVYKYDVLGLTGVAGLTDIANEPALDTPTCNHTAVPKVGASPLHSSLTSLPITFDITANAAAPDLHFSRDSGPMRGTPAVQIPGTEADNVTMFNTDLPLAVTAETGAVFELYRSGVKLTPAAVGVLRTVADLVTLADDADAATAADRTVTSATAAFAATDVGKAVTGALIPEDTTISRFVNATTVELSKNPTEASTATGLTILGTTVTDKANGVDSSAIVTTGSYLYRANVTDLAGNTASVDTIVFIDLDNPFTPTKLDLVRGSDTGSSDADDITADTTPTFNVTGVEDTAFVELFACEGASCGSLTSTTVTRTGGGSILAPTAVNIGSRTGSGEITAEDAWWNKNVRIKQADNYLTRPAGAPATGLTAWPATNSSWRFNVRQTDLSGRISCTNAPGTCTSGILILGGPFGVQTNPNTFGYSVDLNVVIDTTPEDAPSAPTLVDPGEIAAAANTGSVAPTFNIATGSGRVELLRDGVVVGSRTGAGNISDPGPLSNGTYFYKARSVDTAGNVSPESEALEVTVQNAGGYWLVGGDGGVFAFGDAGFFGSLGDKKLNAPVLGVAATPSKAGYWLYAADGGVFAFGDAGFFGSTGGMTLNKPIVGMVPTMSGNGYYLFAGDGGVFTFGDAQFLGSPAAAPGAAPIVGMAIAPNGVGYWLVDDTGKVYGYGSAASLSGVTTKLNAPIVGMAVTPSGKGMWLVGADGGVFTIGDAVFKGSTGAMALNKPIIGIEAVPAGDGYWLFASDGGVFAFGAAPHHGSTGSLRLNGPIVGMSTT